MHKRLPEEDEEEILQHSTKPAGFLSVSTQGRKGEYSKEKSLKYFIIAGLAVVIIIILFYSSHQKVRIFYISSLEDKQVKRTNDGYTQKANQLNPVKQKTVISENHADAKQGNEHEIDMNKDLPISSAQPLSKQKDKAKQPTRLNRQQKQMEPTLSPLHQGDQKLMQQDKEQQNRENERMKQIIQRRKTALQQRKHENPQERLRKNAEKNKLNPPAKPNYQNNQFAFSPETLIKQQPKDKLHNLLPKDMSGQAPKDSANNEKKQEEKPRGNFQVPHFVWTYSQKNENNSFFVSKCLENIKYFASKSAFQMNILSQQNYKDFLQPETTYKIVKVTSVLKERIAKQPSSNLKYHFSTIKKRLISLHVLNEKGGIFIEKNVLFTQSFQWLKEIEDNMYVNKGSGRVRAKYFGFFDIDHGSLLERHNKTGINYDTEKYMIEFPCVEPYFFAAQARQAFLTETLAQYIELLTNPTSLQEKMKKYKMNIGTFKGQNHYQEAFYICQHVVLHRKQQQINILGNNKFDNTFAIDYYGLLTMNERYFPKKMDFFFQNRAPDKVYWNLARYSRQELKATAGPMRYVACMPLQKYVDNRLQKARKMEEKYFIHPQSFLSKFVIKNSSQPFIIKEYQKSIMTSQAKSWEKLPKIIWLYWDKGLQDSSIANKLFVDNLRRTAAQNNFQLKQLNDSNTAEYLGIELNEKINNSMKNAKVQTFPQTKSDFVRLAIIAKYGGIYMDPSYFSIKGLEWIVNIAQAPTETIFNRYGEMPRVLMFFHPHYANAFDWTYDKQANTKKLVLNAYENSFVAAEPNQQFIWDWFEEFVRFITSSSEQSEQLMKEFGVLEDNWGNVYLAAMDSVKIVIGKKNKEIQKVFKQNPNDKGPKSAAQFYGLWSVSGYREQQKFRSHTNFDNTINHKQNDQNIFLWRYSDEYVQGLLGNITHLAKLYGQGIMQMNKFLATDYESNFTDMHPHSFMAKYLYNPQRHKLTKHEDQLSLEVIRS